MDWFALDGFVDLDEAARRMGISRTRVLELISTRALRAVPIMDDWLVEPAILSM